MTSIRNFCFTLNNWTGDEYKQTEEYLRLNASYAVIGKEVGDEGTQHLQGYVELISKTRFTTIKKNLPRAHIEVRRGTALQASDYCKKDNDYLEFGEISKQGHRTDLDTARRMAADEGMRAVSATCSYQQILSAEKYLTYNETARDFKPMVIWIWGPSGCGKSKLARELCGEDVYVKNDPSKWWNGYDAHDFVIIDDFRDSWFPMTELLRILDRYECRLEYKGGFRQLLAKTIIITTILPPKSSYGGHGEPIEQLLRRIDDIVELSAPVPDVPEVDGNTKASTSNQDWETI